MRQMENTISVPVIILTLGFFSFLSFAQDASFRSDDAILDSEFDFDRRPQDVGLGKRVYGRLSEYKRLPVYNFGLGKRSYSYNFGLGKRSNIEEDTDRVEEYDEYPYTDDQMPELELYHDDSMQSMDKRPKLYSFGLGKRQYDFGLGKRVQIHRYDFGLGKRSESAPNRLYNFGLGKRAEKNPKGKRPDNKGRIPMYDFGLGRRSEYGFEDSKNLIAKREVHEEQAPASRHGAAAESTKKLEKLNGTAELESHEIMGHSGKSQLFKRSPYGYSFETGKSPALRPISGFSRQFRQPLYNFGLGKRTSLKDLNSQTFKSDN